MVGFDLGAFGLDIGSHNVRVVQLRKKRNGLIIFGVNEVEIPPSSLQKNGIKNKEQLISAIKQALQGAKPHSITSPNVISALPESLIFSKIIQLPILGEKEIDKAVRFQQNTIFPLPPKDLYFDYSILEKNDQNQLDVLVVASPKILVDQFIDLINSLGRKLIALETKPLSMVRSFAQAPDALVLVNIGDSFSSIILSVNGVIRLSSTVNVTAKTLSSSKSYLSLLIDEIKRLLKYFQNRVSKDIKFNKIILLGAGGALPGLSSNLEKALKISAPKVKLPVYWHDFHPRFATALGLALRNFQT